SLQHYSNQRWKFQQIHCQTAPTRPTFCLATKDADRLHGRSVMPEIKTEFLFTIALEVQVFILGDTPYGGRRIARFGSGSFEGPKLKGTVFPGGAGWTLVRRDGVLELNVRLTLETDDKQQIYMTWQGFRHGPKEIIERLDRGESVDPGSYYFRTTPYFETS